ncbi:uracil-DNA glycosylase [Gamsiella multidivaricata]|uniref:uracil-DNA glycosylase n=1 Tax=Gamsiella multidivaricata TaxID=101098 RepID=UPI0022200D0A|nr:uracil-DNA glycosylase [Gamsiella multidivaricata]KAG0371105.1 uracil DNA glycosylase [Gamsiella multidivaricata]KAI7822172.1 uracil-DNA glycosylase [Gamsiella multidivaricata]
MTLTKRPADTAATKDGSFKRLNSGAAADKPAPTKQSSLLAWATPKPKATADTPSSATGTAPAPLIAVGATSVVPAAPKAKPDILKGLPDEKKELLQLEQDTMDATWLRALQAEFTKPYFIELKKFLKQEDLSNQKVFPPKPDIYSWSRFTPLPTVRVVILGQDPYHGDGQAHGLCFSVKKPVRPPPSLLNMFKLLEKDFPGFKIPNHGYLETWARQGVLMVNSAMTVRAHQANSHKGKGWEHLLNAVIKTISDQRRNVVFLLWGRDAQNRGVLVDKKKHLVLQSVHPSPLSAHRGFFDSHHFSKANKYLEQNGQQPINWNSLIDDMS